MMEITQDFRERHLGRIGTNRQNCYSTETHILRSHKNSKHRRTGTSFQLLERQEANYADRVKDITIRLQGKKIQHLKRVIQCPDREVKYLEEILGLRNDKLYIGKERFIHDFQDKNEKLPDMVDQFQQHVTLLHEREDETDRNFMSQGKIIQNQEREIGRRDLQIKYLQEILKSKEVEINKINEQYMKKRSREKDNKLFEEKEQKLWRDKESVFNNRIASLEAELECHERKVRELEEKLASKEAEVRDDKSLLQSTVENKKHKLLEQGNQLHKTKLHGRETEMEKAVFSLNEKNQDLQAEVDSCGLKIKTLHNIFDSKNVAVYGRDERQVKSVMRQKDEQISDLNHQMNQTLKELDDKETEMNGIISSLRNEVDDLKRELERRNMKIKELEISLDFEKKEIRDRKELLKNKVKEKDCQLHKQREQQQQIFERMHGKETEREQIIASLKKKIKHQEAEVEDSNFRVKQLENALNSSSKKIPTRDKPSRDFKQLDNKITELTEQLNLALARLHESNSELDETKTRLSKAMGNMLTDNNPNIADLSDKNRPTKLSERFAELYDNQWTDAFDILDKHFHTEESTITALLQILMDVMRFCKNMGHEQMEDLRRVLAFASKHEDGSVPRDMNKLLKDCRKAMSSVAIGNLYEMYMSHIRQSKDETMRTTLKVSTFTKECLEVCWFMVVQDPPVEFAPVLSKGSRFNTDLFKPYTSSGTYVDYVVWPALLLHEAGPVLTKGVAQGFGKQSN